MIAATVAMNASVEIVEGEDVVFAVECVKGEDVGFSVCVCVCVCVQSQGETERAWYVYTMSLHVQFSETGDAHVVVGANYLRSGTKIKVALIDQ